MEPTAVTKPSPPEAPETAGPGEPGPAGRPADAPRGDREERAVGSGAYLESLTGLQSLTGRGGLDPDLAREAAEDLGSAYRRRYGPLPRPGPGGEEPEHRSPPDPPRQVESRRRDDHRQRSARRRRRREG
ncbi:hypothetical protein ABT112_29445 [Streptomyces sp. NPDC002055]|uniref:hypothetical protein n=1 Tax=Streptomyces sp. NPDC002055 TaxID=3154534 RepID=UPI0033266D14